MEYNPGQDGALPFGRSYVREKPGPSTTLKVFNSIGIQDQSSLEVGTQIDRVVKNANDSKSCCGLTKLWSGCIWIFVCFFCPITGRMQRFCRGCRRDLQGCYLDQNVLVKSWTILDCFLHSTESEGRPDTSSQICENHRQGRKAEYFSQGANVKYQRAQVYSERGKD